MRDASGRRCPTAARAAKLAVALGLLWLASVWLEASASVRLTNAPMPGQWRTDHASASLDGGCVMLAWSSDVKPIAMHFADGTGDAWTLDVRRTLPAFLRSPGTGGFWWQDIEYRRPGERRRARRLGVPLALPIALLAAPAIVAAARSARRRRRLLAGRCIDCGYDVRGSPDDQCPECGTPFDRSPIHVVRVDETTERIVAAIQRGPM